MLATETAQTRAQTDLSATISDPAFPCVGAKSALARGSLATNLRAAAYASAAFLNSAV